MAEWMEWKKMFVYLHTHDVCLCVQYFSFNIFRIIRRNDLRFHARGRNLLYAATNVGEEIEEKRKDKMRLYLLFSLLDACVRVCALRSFTELIYA